MEDFQKKVRYYVTWGYEKCLAKSPAFFVSRRHGSGFITKTDNP